MKITLYVKQHNITGLKYFGKTTRNPFKYHGSGKYWKRHLIKHGTNVTTLNVWEFDTEEDAKIFAIKFSRENNIVESSEWANLREENGKDGAPVGHTGHKFSEEQLEKMSRISKDRWADPEYREKMREIHRRSFQDGRKPTPPTWTEERKQQHSLRMKEIMKERGVSEEFIKMAKRSRTEEENIKMSLVTKGIPKTVKHKNNLSWSKLVKNNASLLERFKDYEDFTTWCKNKFEGGLAVSEIMKQLSVSEVAVRRAISNVWLLKGGE